MTLRTLRTSIRYKFVASAFGTSLAALAIAAVTLLLYDIDTYRKSSLDELVTIAEIIGVASAPALSFRDPQSAKQMLQLLRAHPRVVIGRISDVKGLEFALYEVDPGNKRAVPLNLGDERHAIKDDMIAVSIPVAANGEAIGSVFLQSRYEISTRLFQYLGVLLAVTIASLLAALLMSTRLQRTLTRPIVTLAQATRRVVNDRDFSQRVKKTSTDELGDLVDSFNEMMAEVGRRSEALQASNDALGHEVAERTAAEAALREADRRKDEFIAVLSHELRNPLNPIRNAVALMKSVGGTDQLITTARDIVDRQSGQLSRLIDDLMDASRISQGKMELRLAEVTLEKVVSMAVETAQALFDAKQQVLEVRLPDHPVLLNVDSARIAQVLGNLLNNASKYTDSGGHVVLAALSREGSVEISVTDDGIGLPEDAMPDLFRMFSQIQAHRSRSGGGLGIGLSLSRALVEMHHGTIAASSAGVGKGSRFVVTLPSTPTGPVSAKDLPATDSASREKTELNILIADDVPDAVDSLAALLSAFGHTVSIARDGNEALAQAQQLRPDLAVLDIGMPGLNGYEVAQKIRIEPWGAAMTLIALTGWGQEKDKLAVKEAGFDHHMVKPTDLARLLELIQGAAPATRRLERDGLKGQK
jgi:two-component system, sensor histidine kinase